ncbi:hypothetical protein ACFPIF_01810 [Brevundimonas faecalis]|uniref:hypothetical protein n=1 Tax=Brevundimonas faecalis TaxID=947378 RepID=UPI003611636F
MNGIIAGKVGFMARFGGLTGFEVFVGKGRHARRLQPQRQDWLLRLFMAWMRRT